MRNAYLVWLVVVNLSSTAQVSFERLKNARSEPQHWLTYSGAYDSQRFSRLDQINTANVGSLAAQWVFQVPIPSRTVATPLVLDGIMYLTAENNNAYALDVRSGRRLWTYQRALPQKITPCCGKVNRGFAILGGRLFMATLDAHVVALDSKTGNLLWDTESADYTKGYGFTVAPLVVKDKVIVGISGGEYGIRGFIEAYDAETGKRVWRFNTVPQPGELGSNTWEGDSWQRGGAPAWLTGSYDPELNLVYWATGNPSPSNEGAGRAGDNLFSNSLVALDADSGKLKWFFQFTPHDLHDWDAAEVPVLLDGEFNGKPRKLVAHANRNGFFYLLDRTNGQFLLAKPFAQLTWAKEVDAKGRPIMLPGSDPTPEGNRVCPGAIGATNWMSPSYSPQTGLFYVMAREQCDIFSNSPQPFHAGRPYLGSNYFPATDEPVWGAVRAIEPASGTVKWEYKYHWPAFAGILSTAGGLVFAGDMDGYLIALDARTGRDLWHFQMGGVVSAAPISYSFDGRQYVTVAAANAVFTFSLPTAPMEGSRRTGK